MRKHTFRQEYVRCGKPKCKKCPHGPYWYEFWSMNGKTHKRYVGKDLPSQEEEIHLGSIPPAPDRRSALFVVGCMDTELAASVLGVTRSASEVAIKSAFRSAAKDAHPDRGGDAHEYKLIVAAYEVFCRVRNFR